MEIQQIILRDKFRGLNLQINSQLKSAGVLNYSGKVVNPISNYPESEWKTWILELMEIRDALLSQLN